LYLNGIEFVGEGTVASRLSSINPSSNGRKAYEAEAAESRIEYYHTDHLGNVRLAFSDLDGDNAITVRDIYYPANEIVQERHYYPFGLTHTGPWFATVVPDNAYRYNGIELDESTGLYMAPFRSYDATIGRWTSVDPLTELMPSLTPYRFGFNNPTLYADPLGLFETRGEARRWKRAEGINGRVKKNDDGRFRVDFKGSDGSATINEFGYLNYSARAERTGRSSNAIAETANYGSADTSIVGGVSSAKGFGVYNESARTWQGLNGKQYSFDPTPGKSRPFYGNGSTGGRSLAQSRAGAYGRLGTGVGLVSMGITEVEYQYNLSNNPGPNLRNYLYRKRMADQAMNGVGFLGLKGVAISLGYNGGYIIENLCNCNVQYNPYTGDFTPIEQTLIEADNLGIRLNH
jgi:RHS repeat-associated protein